MRYEDVNALLKPGYLPLETGIADYGDGYVTVCALTRMPRCRARMVAWWFGWLGGTDQYKLWHPRAHLFSDWENRQAGSYIGASHMVHEYLGDSDVVHKLRINFRDPLEFFDKAGYDAFDGDAICARIGPQGVPFTVGRMVHFVRNTDFGCEMRSRFFLGHVQSIDPGVVLSEDEKAGIRQNAGTDIATGLQQHATEEMGYLADLLPVLYRQATGDSTY